MTIKKLLAKISQELDINLNGTNYSDFKEVDKPNTIDELNAIVEVLRNPKSFDESSIEALVTEQINLYKIADTIDFKIDIVATSADFSSRWQAYVAKLELVVAKILARKKAGFELNILMPSQKQILELQHECWSLTAEYYGVEHANYSCFYLYYIRMCEAAHITRYNYLELPKEISADHYVSQINIAEVLQISLEYRLKVYGGYIQQGGIWAHGRSEIDATSIVNVLYYKHAQQLLTLMLVKRLIVQALQQSSNAPIYDYGQLPDEQKIKIWQIIQKFYPADAAEDHSCIFYNFVKFCNYSPGSCFTAVPDQISEVRDSPANLIHAAIKIAGLLSKKLVLLKRSVTENWTPKRYLLLKWQRKYALADLRDAGITENVRLWPNEMPYCSGHGLSLCGDGLVEGLEHYGSIAYEWNVPVDIRAELDNIPRDIEKMFREMKLLCPNIAIKPLLPGEDFIYMFQNTIAYSSQSTQHLHIGCGAADRYKLFSLPANASKYVSHLGATIETVRVGNNPDAMYLRFVFNNLQNEVLIKFILDLSNTMVDHFGGYRHIDYLIMMLANQSGGYAFILEPHARLEPHSDGMFINPENQTVTQRKPQWVMPEGDHISEFAAQAPLAGGLDFTKQFYDDTCKKGVHEFMQQYLNQYFQTQA